MSDPKTTPSALHAAPFRGLRIIEDRNMEERVMHARSPSRAKRRERLGHRQHYAWRPSRQVIPFQDCLVMHPAMVAEMRKATT